MFLPLIGIPGGEGEVGKEGGGAGGHSGGVRGAHHLQGDV